MSEVDLKAYKDIVNFLAPRGVELVAVSKKQTPGQIQTLFDAGQRDFGENYVQELLDKQALLPAEIRWHFIGHLQTNKVKYLAPFIHLIQSADSLKLLQEIDRQAARCHRQIDCLVQVHIAQEETKFGWSPAELPNLFESLTQHPLPHIRLRGLMGMASFSQNPAQVREEFAALRRLRDQWASHPFCAGHFDILSMGMSGDFHLAVEEGSTLVRIGSLIFGERKA